MCPRASPQAFQLRFGFVSRTTQKGVLQFRKHPDEATLCSPLEMKPNARPPDTRETAGPYMSLGQANHHLLGRLSFHLRSFLKGDTLVPWMDKRPAYLGGVGMNP